MPPEQTPSNTPMGQPITTDGSSYVPQPIAGQPMPYKSGSKKNMLVIVVVALAAVLLLAGVGGWWRMQSLSKQYPTSVQAYEKQAKTAFVYYRDSTDVEAHVNDITGKFDAALAAKPAQPKFLGLTVSVKAADKQRVDQLTTALTNLKIAFAELHALNAYAHDTLAIMGNSTGSIDSVDGLKTMKPVFEKAVTDLQALKPPKKAEAFHAAKVRAYQTLVTDVSTALAADSKGNGLDYTVAVLTLSNDVKAASANTAAKELNAIYDEYYGNLIKHYSALADLLHIVD